MSRLSSLSTRSPKELDKADTKEATQELLQRLSVLQNLLYADGTRSLLVILQGLDASGKDGVISKVFGAVNPQGLRIQSFKKPTEKELAHDFLWRVHKHAPPKGMIQVFNRSHYEDVLVTRVHGTCDDKLALQRFKAINDFEQMLRDHNGTRILKFYLHVSADEQEERFEERKNDPAKRWKYNKRDEAEAKLRDRYLEMYEEVFEHCNLIPWHIVPSDHNWYKEHTIASIVVEHLEGLNLSYPDKP